MLRKCRLQNAWGRGGMEAWKHGSREAGKRGSGEAGKQGSGECLLLTGSENHSLTNHADETPSLLLYLSR
jgi:hypothetical protein